jgi:hypothetical protein
LNAAGRVSLERTVERPLPPFLASVTARIVPNYSAFKKRNRDNGKRFVVRADEKLTAFLELELAISPFSFARAWQQQTDLSASMFGH